MVALSVLTLAMVLLVLRPRCAADLLLGLHSRIERILEKAGHFAWLARSRRRHPGRGRGLEPWSRRGRLSMPRHENPVLIVGWILTSVGIVFTVAGFILMLL